MAAHAGECVGEEAAPGGGVLALLLNEFFVKARFQGHLLDQLLVIVGDVQQLGHPLAHAAAAGAELAADGDDILAHETDLL